VLPEPAGVLDRAATIVAIAEAPRWRDVRLEDAIVVQLNQGAAILVYRAAAQRDTDTYRALVSTVYVNRNGSWRLACHQQTPSGRGAGLTGART
jgi:hypothetical protein